MIYLDNSATTRALPEAAEAACRAMTEQFFNPAAGYKPAVEAERAVNAARARFAAALGCAAGEVCFTSGGTESNNMAVFGSLNALRGRRRVITCMNEHPSVYAAIRSLEQRPDIETVFIGCTKDGAADLGGLEDALTEDTALVSLMHVNNETGAVNDIEAASLLVRRLAPDALFHVDGVQAFCKLPFSRIPCDLYSVSAHKFHAPKGFGALYVKSGVKFAGGQIGGGQENGMRSGTTNVPGVLGTDAALALWRANQSAWLKTVRACKERLAKALLTIPDALVNGPSVQAGAPHVLNVSFPGVRGEVLVNALSEREIYVSTGSACSTHKKSKNRVLDAMGISGTRAEGALRFSLSPFNTPEEMDAAALAVKEQVTFLRRFQRR
jgi:cysteine desulfurase